MCKISWCPNAANLRSPRVQMDNVVLELGKNASALSTAAVSKGTHGGKAHLPKKTSVIATIVKETDLP